jgi:hypothetical protein
MRKPPLGTTTRHRVIPCVLLVGADERLEPVLRQCAALAAGARLEVCNVNAVTTRAAEWRPFAIVVPSDVLEFDPAEFVALARTVRADLVPLSSGRATDSRFRQEVVAALRAAFQHREKGKNG